MYVYVCVCVHVCVYACVCVCAVCMLCTRLEGVCELCKGGAWVVGTTTGGKGAAPMQLARWLCVLCHVLQPSLCCGACSI